MSSHGGAVAEGSPYLGSILPVGMLLSTRARAETHRPQPPLLWAVPGRGLELVGSGLRDGRIIQCEAIL
jgi:hypothetical protein